MLLGGGRMIDESLAVAGAQSLAVAGLNHSRLRGL
jgi:hypothetical protein